MPSSAETGIGTSWWTRCFGNGWRAGRSDASARKSVRALCGPRDGQRENPNAPQCQRQGLGPQRLEAHSLEKCGSQDDQEVAERKEIGEPLDGRWHVLDGKYKT